MTLRAGRRMDGIERTLIRQVFDAAPPHAINLGLGQPDLPSPASVCLAGVGGIAAGRTGYGPTAGETDLRAAIAERYRPFASGPESVLVTIGSQEALFACCLTLLDPGDEVLYPDPGYPAYAVVARLVGAVGVPYPLRADRGFRLDPDDVASRLTERTRLAIVCSPSNPTGAIQPRDELARLTASLESHGVAWLSDEIYSGFSYEGPCPSPCELSREGIVISGLSKDMSMTGWRVGWVVGPPEIVARIIAAHQYLVTCASTVSQRAALAAFGAEGERERRRFLELFRGRRSLMVESLAKIEGVRFRPPDGAFYVFADVSRFGSSLPLAQRILERRNVITIPGIAFGPRGEGFLRLSYAASAEHIVEGVRRIGEELRAGP